MDKDKDIMEDIDNVGDQLSKAANSSLQIKNEHKTTVKEPAKPQGMVPISVNQKIVIKKTPKVLKKSIIKKHTFDVDEIFLEKIELLHQMVDAKKKDVVNAIFHKFFTEYEENNRKLKTSYLPYSGLEFE